MAQLISKSKAKGVRESYIFNEGDRLVDPDDFFKEYCSSLGITGIQATQMWEKAKASILTNKKGRKMYDTLYKFVWGGPFIMGEEDRLEPAEIFTNANGDTTYDGRHRAVLCAMLGIKLPVRVREEAILDDDDLDDDSLNEDLDDDFDISQAKELVISMIGKLPAVAIEDMSEEELEWWTDDTDILTENLDKATPYMLRNDGELFKCGDIHPYIKYYFEADDIKNIILLFKDPRFIEWFYNHTAKESTKKLIGSFLATFIQDRFGTIKPEFDDYERMKAKAEVIAEILNIDLSRQNAGGLTELVEIFNELNSDTNQEFLRLRTSSLMFGGDSDELYCRISSVHFNWYPLLWDVVMDNESIESVTISKDTQAFGGKFQFYKSNGTVFDHLSRDEFLTLQGNPIVESFGLKSERGKDIISGFNEGKTLAESCQDLHPKYANGYHKAYIWNGGLEWDISNILQPHRRVS